MHFSTSHPRLFPFFAISILLLVLAGLGSLFFEPAGWQYSDSCAWCSFQRKKRPSLK